jgi:segregation and condensation protein A
MYNFIMEFDISSHHIRKYIVETAIYEGPLDLLLSLIEHAQLDITKLALAEVTDQYLVYIRKLENRTPEEVSAFLLIAAKLIQIKSEILLPRPPTRDLEEEDPGEALARQLLEYKRFKKSADFLHQLEDQGLHTYLRLSPPIRIDRTLDLLGITKNDLKLLMANLLECQEIDEIITSTVTLSKISIREKIGLITRLLVDKYDVSFQDMLLDRSNIVDIIVTFLAILELMKQNWILVNQMDLFGDIKLTRTPEFQTGTLNDLEFGE